MKRWHAISVLITAAAAVVLLAACGSSSKTSSASSTTTASGASATTSSTPASSKTTAGKAKARAKLQIARNAKLGKQILVNAAGTTVYMYMPDGSSTTSKVPAAIKKNWPQVGASGSLSVGAGLSGAKLSVHKQPNGSQQVAYNGHLLYRFVGDKKPGDANGERLGGVWFALLASGDKAA